MINFSHTGTNTLLERLHMLDWYLIHSSLCSTMLSSRTSGQFEAMTGHKLASPSSRSFQQPIRHTPSLHSKAATITMMATWRGEALLLFCLLLAVCSCYPVSGTIVLQRGEGEREGDSHVLSDEYYVEAELVPAPAQDGSAALVEEWSEYIMGLSGLLSVKESVRGGPSDSMAPLAVPFEMPDQRGTPPGYEWRRIGKVLPDDPTPLTEGYRPPQFGYFHHSGDCDALMRLWADTCAFKDAAGNVYHAGPEPPNTLYPAGADTSRPSASTYLAGVLGAWESSSNMASSARRFGGQEKKPETPQQGEGEGEGEVGGEGQVEEQAQE